MYHQSVTEEEIQEGLEHRESSRQRAFLFTRDISDVEAHLDNSAVSKYIDMEYGTNMRDEVACARIQAITGPGGLLDRILPSCNVRRSTVSWNTICGVDNDGKLKYVEKLSKEMKELFVQNFETSSKALSERPSSMSYAEALQHACIAVEYIRSFVGRSVELKMVYDYLKNEGGDHCKPLVVIGEVGIGKSTLMAKAAAGAISSCCLPDDTYLLLRFCGMTPLSSSLPDTLRSVLCQILCANGGKENSISRTFEQLARTFLLELEMFATATSPVVVFLDGIDQMPMDVDQVHWIKSFLGKKLPCHVFVIMSFTRDPCTMWNADLGSESVACNNIVLPCLNFEEQSLLLESTLSSEMRSLTERQKKEVKESVAIDGSPLSFSVAWITARTWSSFMSEESTKLSRVGAIGLIEEFLCGLEKKYDSPGPSLIGKLTIILCLSKSGASRFELERQVGNDPDLMNVLQKWWKLPSANQMPPGLLPRITSEFGGSILHETVADGCTVMRFMNSLFETVVLRRYAPTSDKEAVARHDILSFFYDDSCLVPLPRRVVVAVDQMIMLKDFKKAREFVLRSDIFLEYCGLDSQRAWLLGVLRQTGGYGSVEGEIRPQLQSDCGNNSRKNCDPSFSIVRYHILVSKLYLDMELYKEAWQVACDAVQLLEADIPSEHLANALDIKMISSQEALEHIIFPDAAPFLGPVVSFMSEAWKEHYGEANEVKIRSGSLYYDTLESNPDVYKAVATAVLILSRRVIEIWSENKLSSGYGRALMMAARMSYKQNVIGPAFVDRAICLLNEAVPILVETCGKLSHEVGEALYWLGEAYHEKAVHTMSVFQPAPKVMDMSVALSCLFAAERVLKICLGSMHKTVGMVTMTIGVALFKCNRLRESENYYRLATKIMEVTTGSDSVVTATSLLGLTGTLTMQNTHNNNIGTDILDTYKRVHAIFEKTYGENYDRTVKVKSAIEAIQREINKTNK